MVVSFDRGNAAKRALSPLPRSLSLRILNQRPMFKGWRSTSLNQMVDCQGPYTLPCEPHPVHECIETSPRAFMHIWGTGCRDLCILLCSSFVFLSLFLFVSRSSLSIF